MRNRWGGCDACKTRIVVTAAVVGTATIGSAIAVNAQYYYPPPGYDYPPPPGYGGYGWRIWNGCPPGYTVQGGACQPYLWWRNSGWNLTVERAPNRRPPRRADRRSQIGATNLIAAVRSALTALDSVSRFQLPFGMRARHRPWLVAGISGIAPHHGDRCDVPDTGSICSNGPIDLPELFCAAFQDFQIGIVEMRCCETQAGNICLEMGISAAISVGNLRRRQNLYRWRQRNGQSAPR